MTIKNIKEWIFWLALILIVSVLITPIFFEKMISIYSKDIYLILIILVLFFRILIEYGQFNKILIIIFSIDTVIFILSFIFGNFLNNIFKNIIILKIIIFIISIIQVLIPSLLILLLFLEVRSKYTNQSEILRKLLYNFVLALYSVISFSSLIRLSNPLNISRIVFIIGLVVVIFIIFIEIPGYLMNSVTKNTVLSKLKELKREITQFKPIDDFSAIDIEFKFIDEELVETYNHELRKATSNTYFANENIYLQIRRTIDFERNYYNNLELHPLPWIVKLVSMTGVGILIVMIIELLA